MTREEKQRLRDVLAELNEAQRSAGMTEKAMAALRILDADLSRPEEREWGVRYIGPDATAGDAKGGYTRTEASARELVAESPATWALISRTAVSRTPAGPWEKAI